MSHRSRTSIILHTVWSTRHRIPLLLPAGDGWLRTQMQREAAKLRCELLAFGNASDHAHAVLSLATTVSLAQLMKQLKGARSYAWNSSEAADPADDVKRIAWQDGYWAESCAPHRIGPLIDYVERQRELHAQGGSHEAWMQTDASR